MPIYHYTPPINDKRAMVKGDWAGWYQLSVAKDGKLTAEVRWWNGRRWNHHPNLRGGWDTEDIGDIRGIVRMAEV